MNQKIMPQDLWLDLLKIRSQAPLIHSITNFVAMNFNANILLALGASPVMAHSIEEVEDMVGIAQSLVLNIGTLEPDWIYAMRLAKTKAHIRGLPVILDPVGAGATPYRSQCVEELISKDPPNIIRGNASEIMSVAGLSGFTKGVDSSIASDDAILAAFTLAKKINGVVCISGKIDHVVDHLGQHAMLSNGSPLMTKVTGVGCSATAIIGAFSAVQPNFFRATLGAMAYLSVAGEVAAKKTILSGSGSGTYQINLLDAIELLEQSDFNSQLNMKFFHKI